MVPSDLTFLRKIISRNLLVGPVLEVGSAVGGGAGAGNASELCRYEGFEWQGCDLAHGPGVDFLLDICDDAAVERLQENWGTVLLFNLLEHVYDPISALRNALRLARHSCVVASPAVWELHDFPHDYWRPLPDFYLEFSRREKVRITEDLFVWMVGDKMLPVLGLARNGQKLLPSKAVGPEVFGQWPTTWSRVIHRLANTTGRVMFFPFSALGVVLCKGEPTESTL